MERRFQYYVPFTNHTQYRARARARAREHNNTVEKFILNFKHLFHAMSTGYVRTHIYIEEALSAWIPLVSVFCSSGAVSGILGKQMTPAVASELSIFIKNHDYNTYILSFPCRGEHVRTYNSDIDARGGRKLRTDTHTHTTVTITIKIIRSAEAQ